MEFDNSAVRRKDRTMDLEASLHVLKTGEYGYLSMIAPSGEPYGIPVSYVWDGEDIVYLHCAPEGKKLQCIKTHPDVSFCVVGKTQVIPVQFTTAYESCVWKCRASVGLSEEERRRALKLLIEKYAPDLVPLGMTYMEKSFHRTEIVRLQLISGSGKHKVVKK